MDESDLGIDCLGMGEGGSFQDVKDASQVSG
jgi:hypothetical protein